MKQPPQRTTGLAYEFACVLENERTVWILQEHFFLNFLEDKCFQLVYNGGPDKQGCFCYVAER